MSQEPALPHGEFEITESPGDAFRGLYAGMGAGLIFFLLIWLAALAMAVPALLRGEEVHVAVGIFAVMGLFLVVLLASSALRALGRKSWLVRITDHSIAARRESGEITLNWAAIERVNERAGIMILVAGRLAIALPLYRMSEVQVAAIRARLAASGVEERAKKQKRAGVFKLVVLWILLVLMFVALYNLMSPP
jgi:hypothetical protein